MSRIANLTPDPVTPSSSSHTISQETTPTNHPHTEVPPSDHLSVPTADGGTLKDPKNRGPSATVTIPTVRFAKSDTSCSSSMETTSVVTPGSSNTSVRSITAGEEDSFDKSAPVSIGRREIGRGEEERRGTSVRQSVELTVPGVYTADSSSVTDSVVSTPNQGQGELSISDLTPSETQATIDEHLTPHPPPPTTTLPLQRKSSIVTLYRAMSWELHLIPPKAAHFFKNVCLVLCCIALSMEFCSMCYICGL